MPSYIVTSGFDTDEETINFGTRAIVQTNGSIYESLTIATIQPGEELAINPQITASIEYSKFCIAVNEFITVFDNDNCNEVILSANFDSCVSSYCISTNGHFLFVILYNGWLYCLHLATGGQIIFSKKMFCISKDEKFIIKMFMEKETGNLILISACGTIYRIRSFEQEYVHLRLINTELDKTESVIKDLNYVELCKSFPERKISSVTFNTVCGEMAIAILGPSYMGIWPSKDVINMSMLTYTYKKVQFFENYSGILCLSSKNSLHIINSHTFTSVKVYNGPVLDYITIQDENESSLQVLVLMEPEDNAITTYLRLMSFPDFTINFEISVSRATCLVQTIGCCTNNFIYLEGILSTSKILESLRIKTLVEGNPEFRLERLLRRRKFNEAEEFAENFGLNKDPIYRAKAAFLVSQLNPWTENHNDPAKLEIFINILDKIKDVHYVVDCCSKVLLTRHDQMKRLLLYSQSRIIQNIEETRNINTNEEENSKLLATTSDTLYKLEIFELLKITAIDSYRCNADNVNEWLRFSKANMFEELINRLQLGELEAAVIIWTRCYSSITQNISIETVRQILDCISEKASSSEVEMWLCHLVPSIMSLIPNALPDVVMWVCNRVHSMEKSHLMHWPEIGLKFIRNFVALLNTKNTQFVYYVNQDYHMKYSVWQKLTNLSQALRELLLLKKIHRLTIPLDMYSDDPIEVLHLCLNEIKVEDIPLFMEKSLRQHITNYDLENDIVLSSYIRKKLRMVKDWWFLDEAPWEKRLIMIVSYVHDIETRLKLTLDILKKAPVPWSSNIVSLVEVSCTYNHDFVRAIQKEYKIVNTKLVLKKYGYHEVGICENLIYYVFEQNLPDMMTDIHILTKNNQDLQISAVCRYLIIHINKGNIEEAFKIMDLFESSVMQYCCEWIINLVQRNVHRKMKNKEYWIESLNFVKNKLETISTQTSLQFNNKYSIIWNIKTVYNVQKEFQIEMPLVRCKSEKRKLLENYIHRVNIEVKNGSMSVLSACNDVQKIADALSLSRILAINLLFKSNKDSSILKHFVLKAVEMDYFNNTENDILEFDKLFLNIMMCEMDTYEIKNALKSLYFSVLDNCTDIELENVLFLATWINRYVEIGVCEKLVESNGNIKSNESNKMQYVKCKLATIYMDPAISSNCLLKFFQNALKVFLFYAEQNQKGQFFKHVRHFSGSEVSDFLEKLPSTEESLRMKYHDLSLLKITKTLYDKCLLLNVSPDAITKISSVLFSCSFLLLEKLVGVTSFDLNTGLVCLFTVPREEALRFLKIILKSSQDHHIRNRAVSELGFEYYNLIHKNTTYFRNLRLHHHWAQKLNKYSVPYKEILHSGMEGKKAILERILNANTETNDVNDILQLMEEYCDDFGFNKQDCFVLYLQILLSKWKPVFNVTTEAGNTKLKIDEQHVKLLKYRCKAVIRKIEDKNIIRDTIHSLKLQISYYHYEVFLLMFDLIEEDRLKERDHISFLQLYIRVGNPSDVEKQLWEQLKIENCTLPTIAKYRLPFLPVKSDEWKINKWKIISPELNLKTYEKWLRIAPILELNKNMICMLCIRGSVDQVWSDFSSDSKEWILYSKNNALLQEIKKCILRMNGSEALEMSTSILYYIMNKIPRGVDKVIAARECYMQAQLFAKEPNAVKEKIQTIQQTYYQLATEHILHSNGLGEKRYLSLALEPRKLIREMYNDESIPLRYSSDISRKPDINSAATSIGELFSENMIKLRLELIHEWLQPEPEVQMDETITENFTAISLNSKKINTCQANLLRICYIIKAGDMNQFVNVLIGIGFDAECNNNRPGKSYRALQILQTVVDANILETLTKRDTETFRMFMKTLQYLSKLENFGLKYSVEKFQTSSKKTIAQLLLQKQSYSQRAVYLVFEICMDFKIYDLNLWKQMLQKMKRLYMINELKYVLTMMTIRTDITSSVEYISCWQFVITETFKRLEVTATTEQIKECVESLRILQVCPVVYELNFHDVIEYCFRSNHPWFAAALLPFVSDATRDDEVKKFEQLSDAAHMMDELKVLIAEGIISASLSLQILNKKMKITMELLTHAK